MGRAAWSQHHRTRCSFQFEKGNPNSILKMVRYGEVNQFTKVSQTRLIEFKVLFMKEFTI